MKPLVINESKVAVTVWFQRLRVLSQICDDESEPIHEFDARDFPYDMVVVQRPHGGYLSIEAIRWLGMHQIPVLFLDLDGRLVSQFLPAQYSMHPEVKLAQFEAFKTRRLEVARKIVEDKTGRRVPSSIASISELMFFEGRQAQAYFARLGMKREQSKNLNSNANDPINCALNYSYSILEAITRKNILSLGLEPSIGFLHEPGMGKEPLVYDLMEPFRDAFTTFALGQKPSYPDCERRRRDLRLRLKEEFTKGLLGNLGRFLEQRVDYKGQRWRRDAIMSDYVRELARSLLSKS